MAGSLELAVAAVGLVGQLVAVEGGWRLAPEAEGPQLVDLGLAVAADLTAEGAAGEDLEAAHGLGLETDRGQELAEVGQQVAAAARLGQERVLVGPLGGLDLVLVLEEVGHPGRVVGHRAAEVEDEPLALEAARGSSHGHRLGQQTHLVRRALLVGLVGPLQAPAGPLEALSADQLAGEEEEREEEDAEVDVEVELELEVELEGAGWLWQDSGGRLPHLVACVA